MSCLRVTIEFDFIQKDLMGEIRTIDVKEGTTLLDLFEHVDMLIRKECDQRTLNPEKFMVLNGSGSFNGCIAAVNGEPPADLLAHVLKDSDTVSLLYGYCGG